MEVTCAGIAQHIAEHEILGVSSGGGGALAVFDEGILVTSGVDTLNFVGGGILATNAGGGTVNVTVPDLEVVSGILWVYDTIRTKWLSSSKLNFGAGEKGRTKNKYLPVFDGQVSNLSGWRVTRNATIVGISAQTKNEETWTLKIRKNGSTTDILSLAMSNVDGNHDTTVNIDLDEGDQIQFYAETTGFFGIRDPLAWVEVAWRNDTLSMP